VIFVDTSFWVALSNRRDPSNFEATELLDLHRSTAWLTTNHVVGETWTFLRRRAGHGPAVRFLDAIEASRDVLIEPVDAATEAKALAWLRRHDEREYSFVDATSFAVMRSERITNALAFDGDFTAAGFIELRP
jgi:predicted nucleic acid-binding protein